MLKNRKASIIHLNLFHLKINLVNLQERNELSSISKYTLSLFNFASAHELKYSRMAGCVFSMQTDHLYIKQPMHTSRPPVGSFNVFCIFQLIILLLFSSMDDFHCWSLIKFQNWQLSKLCGLFSTYIHVYNGEGAFLINCCR